MNWTDLRYYCFALDLWNTIKAWLPVAGLTEDTAFAALYSRACMAEGVSPLPLLQGSAVLFPTMWPGTPAQQIASFSKGKYHNWFFFFVCMYEKCMVLLYLDFHFALLVMLNNRSSYWFSSYIISSSVHAFPVFCWVFQTRRIWDDCIAA